MRYGRMHGRGNARGCGAARRDAGDARGCTVEGTDSVPIAELSWESSEDLGGYMGAICIGIYGVLA